MKKNFVITLWFMAVIGMMSSSIYATIEPKVSITNRAPVEIYVTCSDSTNSKAIVIPAAVSVPSLISINLKPGTTSTICTATAGSISQTETITLTNNVGSYVFAFPTITITNSSTATAFSVICKPAGGSPLPAISIAAGATSSPIPLPFGTTSVSCAPTASTAGYTSPSQIVTISNGSGVCSIITTKILPIGIYNSSSAENITAVFTDTSGNVSAQKPIGCNYSQNGKPANGIYSSWLTYTPTTPTISCTIYPDAPGSSTKGSSTATLTAGNNYVVYFNNDTSQTATPAWTPTGSALTENQCIYSQQYIPNGSAASLTSSGNAAIVVPTNIVVTPGTVTIPTATAIAP